LTELVVFGVVLVGYALVSKRLEGTPITAPLVFVAAGIAGGMGAAAGAGMRSPFPHWTAEALRALPIVDLIFDERGELRPLVNVYVDGVDLRDRDGLETALAGSEEIRLVGAVAGGGTN